MHKKTVMAAQCRIVENGIKYGADVPAYLIIRGAV